MSLEGKKITVGLTGGIACYKVPYLIRSLTKSGTEVQVIMTEAATKFITPLTLETVSERPVAVCMFPPDEFVATRHIDLGQWADLMVVAPATANFLGKVAAGVCDDLLTTVVCASTCPVMVAPAMNPQMWANPITQRNVATLSELGYQFVGPEEGDMACHDSGVGRMSEPEQIYAAIEGSLLPKKKSLAGKKIVVTAGPSREPIDPVRFISNHSSGKMGHALAEAAVRLGAETILISGPTSLPPPAGVKLVRFETTEQLYRAVKSVVKDADCLIMAAAPADYRPVKPAGSKIKKSADAMQLSLEPTIDILKDLAARRTKRPPVVVGFALETDRPIENARKKLKEKKLDLIVLNTVGADTGFDSDTNQVTVLRPKRKPVVLPLAKKTEIAVKLLEMIASML